MEVHHHPNSERKKFKHYLFEFFMLFLAVFCGFLAEYQLEHIIEKQRAKDYTKSIHRDLSADTTIFNNTIERLTICTKKIDTLVELLGNAEESQKRTAFAYHLSVYAFIYPDASPNETTLLQLINSGSLRYIKNSKLVDSLKHYFNNIQLLKDFYNAANDINRDFRKNQLQFIDINPLLEYMQMGGIFSRSILNLTDTAFFNNRQLLTNTPLQLKNYANWCVLKKFYLINTIYRFKELKLNATNLLKLLDTNK